MKKNKILSTKKLDPLLKEKAGLRGIEIIEKDFISIQPYFTEEKKKYALELIGSGIEHIIFTSPNAVTELKPVLQNKSLSNNLKLFCISGRTKEAIINSGFPVDNIIAIAENAETLAGKIIEQKIKDVIFFCSNHRRDALPELLKNTGVHVTEVIVYETIQNQVMISDDFDAVLFFSPSAVQSFFSMNQLKKNVVCFTIGQTTADSLRNFTDNKIIASTFPSQEMMLDTAQKYLQNINQHE